MAQFSFLLILSTPFFVAYRLKIFREEGRKGVISFREVCSIVYVFFSSAAIIFSFLQWLYMRFLDNGKLLMMFSNIYSSAEGKKTLTAMGFSYNQFMAILPDVLQPYSIASSTFITAVLFGAICSLLIAGVVSKNVKRQ